MGEAIDLILPAPGNNFFPALLRILAVIAVLYLTGTLLNWLTALCANLVANRTVQAPVSYTHLDVTSGQVLVEGADVRDYPLEELRSRIGLVPQQVELFSGTIADNIRWGAAEADDEQDVYKRQGYKFVTNHVLLYSENWEKQPARRKFMICCYISINKDVCFCDNTIYVKENCR